MVDTLGEADLRKEYIDGAVKAVALQEYKLKTLCTIDNSSAFTESYYRETNTELTGGTGSNVRGIPRLAPFPYAEVSWTKVSSIIQKYGMEGVVSFEDMNSSNIPVLQREILRIGRAVAYSIDVVIEAAINTNAGNSLAITAGSEWDSATIANQNPVKNILDAVQTMRADNIRVDGGNVYLVVNGTDYANLMQNAKFTNNPSFKTADVVSDGSMGQVCGCKIMVTDVVTADQAYLVVKGEALTWKSRTPLTVVQIEDPAIKTTIRAYEEGVCQVVSPNALCKITNTRA